MVISSSTDIVIEEQGIIDGNGCGLQKGSDFINSMNPKYGQYIGSSDEMKVDGAGGGIIVVKSNGNFTNNGSLECTATNSDYFSGGTIMICGDGRFENNGVIDCGPNGMVMIGCTEFESEGVIAPNPSVIIGAKEETESLFVFGVGDLREIEKRFELKVHQFRGSRYGDEHPQNLLKEGTESRYLSASVSGPPNEDWIIFELDEESSVVPSTLKIRNDNSSLGIKHISISIGSAINDFEEWIEIKDIKKNKDILQEFPVDTVSTYFAVKKQFKFLKLRILENYGNRDDNVFYEFVFCGVLMQ